MNGYAKHQSTRSNERGTLAAIYSVPKVGNVLGGDVGIQADRAKYGDTVCANVDSDIAQVIAEGHKMTIEANANRSMSRRAP